MKFHELQSVLESHPNTLPRFVLPDGGSIPAHAHITEVGHLVRNFIDCGGLTGKAEKVVLQTHVGDDTDHRLRAHALARILQLGEKVLPKSDLDVEVEYDCCVVSQYPLIGARATGDYLDLTLGRGRTQCRARERQDSTDASACCATAASCC